MECSAHAALLAGRGRGVPALSLTHAGRGLERGEGLVGAFGAFAVGFSPLPEPGCAQEVQRLGVGADLGSLCQLWEVLDVQLGCWVLNRREQ